MVLGQTNNSYSYDPFGRLSSLQASSGASFSYVYDRWGNRWQQNVTSGSGPQPQLTFNTSTNQITTNGYTYDAAGNMTDDGVNSYTYDAEGNVTKTDGGAPAGGETFTYNAVNQRVRRDQGSTLSFEYILNPEGQYTSWRDVIDNWTAADWYYWGAEHLGFYACGTTNFEHHDWNGSLRRSTGATGQVAITYTALPFGDGDSQTSYNCTDSNHYDLLDHDNSGAEHAQFREYSNMAGRWFSPDPYPGSYDPNNPQSFNRYAYVLNNPLSFIDPAGLGPGDCFLSGLSGNTCSVTVSGNPPGGPGGPSDGSVGIPLIFKGGQHGQGGPGTAPNNGQPKSPARQQCEQQALQQFQQGVQAENAAIPGNLKTAAGEGFVGGLIGGCVFGAAAASETGPGAFAACAAAGVDGALWGAFTAPIVSFGHSVFSEVGMTAAYKNQINNVCSKL